MLTLPEGMWDLASPTRDQTRVPCRRSIESELLDCQGVPSWLEFRTGVVFSTFNVLFFFDLGTILPLHSSNSV